MPKLTVLRVFFCITYIYICHHAEAYRLGGLQFSGSSLTWASQVSNLQSASFEVPSHPEQPKVH